VGEKPPGKKMGEGEKALLKRQKEAGRTAKGANFVGSTREFSGKLFILGEKETPLGGRKQTPWRYGRPGRTK